MIGFIDGDEERQELYDNIDYYFVVIYIVEFALKIIAQGILAYFRDNWNKLDFGLIVTSLTTDLAFSMFKVIRNARSVKATRIVRINKTYRLMRVLRSFRVDCSNSVLQVHEEGCLIPVETFAERQEIHPYDLVVFKPHIPDDDSTGDDIPHLRAGRHDHFQR